VKRKASHVGTEDQRMRFLVACDDVGILKVLEDRKDNLQNFGSGLFAYSGLIVNRGCIAVNFAPIKKTANKRERRPIESFGYGSLFSVMASARRKIGLASASRLASRLPPLIALP
jgi:hypothetical protein